MIFIVLKSAPVFATVPVHFSMTKNFYQSVQFEIELSKIKPSSIVYGNELYGFFESRDFSRKGNRIIVRLVPPGYRGELSFWIKTKNRKRPPILLGKRGFQSPLPKAYKSIKTRVRGEFSSSFFYLSGSLPISSFQRPNHIATKPNFPMKNNSRFSFMMIVNRLGEIVWVYLPRRNKKHFAAYVYGKRIGKGVFGIIMGKKDGYFAKVDFRGDVISSLDSTTLKRPFALHHDYELIGPNKDTLLTISNKKMSLTGIGSIVEGRSFLMNTILRIDLKKSKVRVALDPTTTFNPATESHWVENMQKKRFVSWDETPADHDFHHANTIKKIGKKGYLLSFKHLDKIVMMSRDFKKIIWTVGRTKKDTFRPTKESSFSHPHTPHVLANGNILMFDNGFSNKHSRVLEVSLNKEKGIVEKEFEFRGRVKLYSKNRSSVFPLENGNLVALFVSPARNDVEQDGSVRRDYLFEIDRSTGKEKARMVLRFLTISPGYRATPGSSIGREEFIGYDFEKSGR